MSDKINLHICLMLSVYKSFQQIVKYGCQSNHIWAAGRMPVHGLEINFYEGQ